MATTSKTRRTANPRNARSMNTSGSDWIRAAKREKMTVELNLVVDGKVIETIPVPFTKIGQLGLNVTPFQKRVIAKHGQPSGQTAGNRRAA